MEKIIEQAKEYLPFLIPLIIVQFSLLINFVGPILYLIFGKEDE